MRKHSSGAILYTIYNHKVYIVLGQEKGDYFPFKGVRENYETNKQTAIREIFEETCGVLTIKNINLLCNFSTKRKCYHIGLVYISLNEIEQFNINKKKIENDIENIEKNWIYLEKTDMKIFKLDYLNKYKFHEITYKPIKFYQKQLTHIQNSMQNSMQKSMQKSIQNSIQNRLTNTIPKLYTIHT
jgi:hypothetical protein